MTDSSSHPVFYSQDVPRSPGVYVYRNSAGEVIYVGKARNLRSRMSSYFRPSGALRSDPRRRALI
ncbi:MAG TPA: GIY-YIG nuclease family protein, partial [Lentisphaeria bacterium]|nr:GIY-YIG nuclease family protein [Lentisphaeria bacterium]